MPEFTVSFNTDGGSEVTSQTITYGNKATRPSTNPTKEGYIFDDWYTTDAHDVVFDFDNTEITGNSIIYAHFEELKVCTNNENITTLSSTTCANNENITVGNGVVCKRAINLHEEECSSGNCSAAGYSVDGSKGTTTITYGSCGTSGTLTGGDAFTCDVNGDKTFDELTERFYYVSDYYDTNTKAFDSSTATLIYYNNVTNGLSCNKDTYAYNTANVNFNGPRTVVLQLPTINQWRNVSLKNTSRQILAENDNTYTSGGDLINFDYSPYSARLITYQEIRSACGNDLIARQRSLEACNYLYENSRYANPSVGNRGSWTETPLSYHPTTDNGVLGIYSNDRDISYGWMPYNKNYYGARPVIEVPKSKISY
jgi:uncharacterized repeat protein (TIGR02543 family)